MKSILVLILLFAVSQMAIADITENYGWEGTDTILGEHIDVIAQISTEHVHGGSQSLYLAENSGKATSAAFVAVITGLQVGDTVDAEFWRYDTTPGVSSPPSCRIWGRWVADPDSLNVNYWSAGGNGDYGPGTGWDLTSCSWESTADTLENLVIEARIYSAVGDAVWIDDMKITSSDGTTIYLPGDVIALENSTWADIKAAF